MLIPPSQFDLCAVLEGQQTPQIKQKVGVRVQLVLVGKKQESSALRTLWIHTRILIVWIHSKVQYNTNHTCFFKKINTVFKVRTINLLDYDQNLMLVLF